MDVGLIHGLWTLAVFVIFIGIVAWAWSSKRKRAFEEAARLPLEDDTGETAPPPNKEKHNA